MRMKRKIGIGFMDADGAPLKYGDEVIIKGPGREYCADIVYDRENYGYKMIALFARDHNRRPWKRLPNGGKTFWPDSLERAGRFGRRRRQLKEVHLIMRSIKEIDGYEYDAAHR